MKLQTTTTCRGCGSGLEHAPADPSVGWPREWWCCVNEECREFGEAVEVCEEERE